MEPIQDLADSPGLTPKVVRRLDLGLELLRLSVDQFHSVGPSVFLDLQSAWLADGVIANGYRPTESWTRYHDAAADQHS